MTLLPGGARRGRQGALRQGLPDVARHVIDTPVEPSFPDSTGIL